MAPRPQPRPREDFRHFVSIPTRWHDNDVYGHVNNVVYYAFFDTAVNRYLVEHADLDPMASDVIGLVVETGCAYFAPISFPEVVEVGLSVARIGETSVRYELGVFAEGAPRTAAHGHFVHVYVDAKARRPTPLPAKLQAALERLRA